MRTPTPALPADDVHRETAAPPARGLDALLERAGVVAHALASMLLYGAAALALGAALAPALWTFAVVATAAPVGPLRWPALGVGAALSFFVFGFALMAATAGLNALLPTRVRPQVGTYYRLAVVPWFLHNGLFYLVRFTFLPFVTFTPFGVLYLRAMGMTVGRRVVVNTELLSDVRLLTLGDHVVLGGSARVFAHHGGAGRLTIAPVVIGSRVTIGVGATVMGGCVVGDDATLLPHSVLLPGSQVGSGEVWGGVPARPIPPLEFERLKDEVRRRR